jgi:hypothetical protein
MLDINDYLIDQEGKDWADLLSGWSPPLPEEFTIWMVNRIGDVIAVYEDGSVHMLDVGAGTVQRLANDRDDFFEEIGRDENANLWLAIGLIDACVSAGLRLGPDECYSFKIPPLLGGQYEAENLHPCDLSVHYSFLADIHRQTKDLPDGTRVNIKVVD